MVSGNDVAPEKVLTMASGNGVVPEKTAAIGLGNGVVPARGLEEVSNCSRWNPGVW
jgi:hypothetical protein